MNKSSELFDFCQSIVGSDGLDTKQFEQIAKKYNLDAIGDFSSFDTNFVTKDDSANRIDASKIADEIFSGREKMEGGEISKALWKIILERNLKVNLTINSKDTRSRNPQNIYQSYAYTKEQLIELLVKQNNFVQGDGIVTRKEMFSTLSQFFRHLDVTLNELRKTKSDYAV